MQIDLDVAISFVHQDLAIATALRDGLGTELSVFIYTERQEELAGTDGLGTFREVFRSRSRIAVVLYRDGWGATPWTRVEMEAITDRFLKEGPGFLFFINVDGSLPPPWLPEKLIRFSLKDFPLEQAIGAIKARALEQGASVRRPTTGELAARADEAAAFERRKIQLSRTPDGVQEVEAAARGVINLISQKGYEAQAAAPGLKIQIGVQPLECIIKTPDLAVHGFYENLNINALEQARFWVRELRGPIQLPSENLYYHRPPLELTATEFRPELDRSLGWAWKSGVSKLYSSEQLADHCLERFFDLARRGAASQLPNYWDR